MATQQDVIKKFMASLDKTTLSGTEAVDEAIHACSDFNSLQEVIDQMVSDCRTVNNAKNFLLNYCGINLDNGDTGAITGFDAGGSVYKDAEDIVPETGELINFTGNSFTVNGLTLQLEENFDNLTDSQKFIWQGLYTWWAKGALDLIAESYGNNFGFDSNSSATFNTLYVYFCEYSNALAWIGGSNLGFKLCISNNHYINNTSTVNPNGLWAGSKFFLDRTLAHEFTHAVMYANIDTGSPPEFIMEGMAELTHGIDDERLVVIMNLAGNAYSLMNALNLEEYGTGNVNAYAGGYMLLRYLAKQAADEDDVIRNTTAAITLKGTSSDDKIQNIGSSVTIGASDGNDVIENSGSYVTIDAGTGNDYIYNMYNDVMIYGGEGNDTIKSKNHGAVIYSGDGNDLIISSISTINGGSGNDTLDVRRDYYKSGGVYQYAQGDGIDIIIGFNSFDKLEITSGTYSTTKSGNDLVVNVGTGSITLKDIYTNEYTKVNIVDARGKKVTLNDWSIMSGNSTANSLYNADNNVTISGLGGNDTIENYGYKVSISGGADDDSIYNDADTVTVDGGAGNDLISIKGSSNKIYGGDGDDTIYGRGTIYGGNGDDYISSHSNNIKIDAGSGNDTLNTKMGTSSSLFGGEGNDIFNLYASMERYTSTINGGIGNDTLNYDYTSYERTDDHLYRSIYQYTSGDGEDVITGFTKYDKIEMTGASYSTVISGNDIIIRVGKGSITLKDAKDIEELNIDGNFDSISSSDSGKDISNLNSNTVVNGTEYNDTISNTGYKVTINGGAGNDIISNSATGFVINGGTGNDFINSRFEGNTHSNSTIDADDGNDTVSVNNSWMKINGGSGNDSIFSSGLYNSVYAGNGDDTIISYRGGSFSNSYLNAGLGNDVITVEDSHYSIHTIKGDKGNDTVYAENASMFLYQYENGDGNDIIYGFTKNDTLQITDAQYTTIKSGNDLKVSVGNGSILLKNAANIEVNIDGEYNLSVTSGAGIGSSSLGGGISTETLPAGISIKSSVLTASTKFVGNKINLSEYLTATKVNAAALSKGVSIVGTTAANSIKGGKGADTISGGNGNDTLTGGAGADIFIYSGGNDLITDYKSGEDKISISYTSSSVKGSDVILTTSNGNLTIKGAKDKVVSFVDGKNKIFYSNISYTPLATGLKYDAKRTTLTVDTKFTGSQIDLQDYLSTVTKVNASALSKGVSIVGTAAANLIKGGDGNDKIYGGADNDVLTGESGNDTLYGGAGNDTLTGGKGNDVFIHESGNDVITDYSTGEDTIKLTTGSVISASLKSTDVVLKTSTGSVTVQKGSGKKITVTDGNGNTATEYYGLVNYSADKKTITLSSAFNTSLKAEDYATTVTKIDASAVTKSINIVGNTQNNTILGSSKAETIYGGTGNDSIVGNAGNDKLYGDAGADSLNGGKGNDTLTGGEGSDVFFYASGEGNDVIADFTVGQDKINVTSGTISSVSLKSSDMVLKIGSGTLTVKNGKNKEIAIGNSIYYNNLIYDTNKTAVTVGASFSGSLKSTDYSTTIKTINASSVAKSINIIGNSQDNTIIGSSKAETIYGGTGNDSIVGNAGNDKLYGDAGNDKLLGGEGNDTLSGGAGNDTLTGGNGKDIFAYEGGNDVITDYSAGQDTIKINNGAITKTSYRGNNVVFSVGSGSITVQNGKGKKIAITDSNNKTTTQTYTQGVSYVSASNARWFTEDDNNFITDNLQISAITKDTESNYVTEQTEIFKKASEFAVTDSIVSSTSFDKK